VSIKAPLTSWQWFMSAGQPDIWHGGTRAGPVRASQVMPDGSTLSSWTFYTARGKVATVVDAQERQTIYEYYAFAPSAFFRQPANPASGIFQRDTWHEPRIRHVTRSHDVPD
jgi:hypothetical protein